MKKLFLLDGMALVYRAHFALIARPIFSSKGMNTSAIYGFTQTLLEILKNQKPTHLAVAFDTDAPTARHTAYADYKATRQAMPEDLSQALPHVERMLAAFRVPVLTCDGYEADDIIGTLVRQAEKQGFVSYMVTPDKDFGQLIDANTFLYKPSRMGDGVEVLGLPEILQRWGIQRPEQVIDVLALMGDSSDNIPGVPGIGEKTAIKLISQFGSVENLLARSAELTGKMKETVEKNREMALLSKRLVTIDCDSPCPIDLESLKLQPWDEPKVKELLIEFEFNSIGKRLFGEDFKAGRGFSSGAASTGGKAKQDDLVLEGVSNPSVPATAATPEAPRPDLKALKDVAHEYMTVNTAAERARLVAQLLKQPAVAFSTRANSGDARKATILGLAFSFRKNAGFYVNIPQGPEESLAVLREFQPILASDKIEKIGHDLKLDLRLLGRHGIMLGGKLFDTMIAHSLIEPDMRHSLEFLSESLLGRTPASAGAPASRGAIQGELDVLAPQEHADEVVEKADLALQLREILEPLLKEKKQEQVFYDIESPLLPVLARMEHEGIRVDAAALADFGRQLTAQIEQLEKEICQMAGSTFNVGSPKQLGIILFETLKICEKPKKTKTGQYATDEQTLLSLAPEHPVVQKLLEHRASSKLKSTYADALPVTIYPPTGRIHTTYNQVMTSTGRLNSQDPNLQNIPIRSDRGQEIRKAFIPRDEKHKLLSADYSQIELRIIAALSQEPGLLEAFRTGADVHTATAARVYDLPMDMVTPDMRRKAKMVNYGIAYGISAFGLAQRLNIPRKEGAAIIEQYFKQFFGIRKFMDHTMQFARKHGFVETVTGRRRYIRDINSSNATVRGSAERNAINAPIQGSAADMIKIAMVAIDKELAQRKLRTRMLLQVHDELVFDLYLPEEKEVRALIDDKMTSAIKLEVPIEVEIGVGDNWLEAH
jgi:DNA polymerase-1